MIKAMRTGIAAVLAAMVFAGNVIAGDEDSQDTSQTPHTKGMGVSSETTQGTATEGSTTSDADSMTPEEAIEEGHTGAHQ